MEIKKEVNKLVDLCHGQSVMAGWWEDSKTGLNLSRVIRVPDDELEQILGPALLAQKLCLIHSEISEAMEGARKSLKDDKLPHRTMLEVELADAAIRIFDLAGAMRLDLGGAIAEKLEFNKNRPDHKIENRIKENGKKF